MENQINNEPFNFEKFIQDVTTQLNGTHPFVAPHGGYELLSIKISTPQGQELIFNKKTF